MTYEKENRLDKIDIPSKKESPMESKLNLITNLIKDLENKSNELEERLSPVLSSPRPAECSDRKEESQSLIINELVKIADSIRYRIYNIQDIIDRLEL